LTPNERFILANLSPSFHARALIFSSLCADREKLAPLELLATIRLGMAQFSGLSASSSSSSSSLTLAQQTQQQQLLHEIESLLQVAMAKQIKTTQQQQQQSLGGFGLEQSNFFLSVPNDVCSLAVCSGFFLFVSSFFCLC
jgi:hypothetical protein